MSSMTSCREVRRPDNTREINWNPMMGLFMVTIPGHSSPQDKVEGQDESVVDEGLDGSHHSGSDGPICADEGKWRIRESVTGAKIICGQIQMWWTDVTFTLGQTGLQRPSKKPVLFRWWVAGCRCGQRSSKWWWYLGIGGISWISSISYPQQCPGRKGSLDQVDGWLDGPVNIRHWTGLRMIQERYRPIHVHSRVWWRLFLTRIGRVGLRFIQAFSSLF